MGQDERKTTLEEKEYMVSLNISTTFPSIAIV